MEEKIKFACSGCGSCCSRVGEALSHLRPLGFPYNANEDGSCEMLTEDKKCSVYENRPLVCRIDRMYNKYHKKTGKSRKEMYREEAIICNKFQEKDGIDKSFRIDLKQYE